MPNSQTPIAQLHLHVPGAYDERTRTHTFLLAKAHVPVARCPCQIASTDDGVTFLLAKAHVPVARCPCQIASTDDGDNHRLIQKILAVVATTTTTATTVTTTTTQHDSRKRNLKQNHVPLSNR